MSIRIDYLPNHKDIKVYQDDEMFCINTDTMVLGEFLEVYKQDVVLDIVKFFRKYLLKKTWYEVSSFFMEKIYCLCYN